MRSHFNTLGSQFGPIPEGCGAKRSHLRPLPRLGLSQLAAFALICGVRIPFITGLPDTAADIARVAITVKCEHRVVFSGAFEIAGEAMSSSAVSLYYSCY